MTKFKKLDRTSSFVGCSGLGYLSIIWKIIAHLNTILQSAWSCLFNEFASSICNSSRYRSSVGGVLHPIFKADWYSFLFNSAYPLNVRLKYLSIESIAATSDRVCSRYFRCLVLMPNSLFCCFLNVLKAINPIEEINKNKSTDFVFIT